MKKIISFLIALILLTSVFVFPASAADNSVIILSSNTVTIGDSVTVTIKFTTDKPMYAYDYKLNYDANFLSYEGKAGVIHDANALSGEKTVSFSYTFKSIKVGLCNVSLTDSFYSSDGINDTPFPGASVSVTVKDVELPANANLSSLTLSSGAISEKLTTTRTKYTASVPYETDKITFYTKTSDAKATVTGVTPNSPLNVGANTFKITVTAQNGSQKIYTVIITRREQGAEETPVEPTPDNPLETVISGKNYEIVTTIPEMSYLQGFTLSSADWNGSQVPVLRDEDNVYTVYYLKEAGATEIAPYIYNDQLKTFEALKHQTFNGKLYIFEDFPNDMAMPGDYYSTYSQIGNYSVKVYLDSNSQMSDFSYVYCYANGNFGLYRYDSKENTIQRYPDIHLVDAPKKDAPAKDNFVTRFASLSTNGKILLIAMLVAAICVIALIVFLIISIIRKLTDKDVGYIEDDFDFDEVTIVNEEEASQLIE